MATEKGVKLDAGKVRMDLLFEGMPDALLAVSQVLTFGATKYTPNGWKDVPDALRRYRGGQLRHALYPEIGEVYDTESKLLHAAHEACNTLFRLQLLIDEGKTIEKTT